MVDKTTLNEHRSCGGTATMDCYNIFSGISLLDGQEEAVPVNILDLGNAMGDMSLVGAGGDANILSLLTSIDKDLNDSESGASGGEDKEGDVFYSPCASSSAEGAKSEDLEKIAADAKEFLEDYKCPICLDTYINTVRVDCSYGHKFCNYCIQCWISIGSHLVTECPVCRDPIFGKRLDLKTDAEIRALVDQLSDVEKTSRLIAIKERLQNEFPSLNFHDYPIPFEFHSSGSSIDVIHHDLRAPLLEMGNVGLPNDLGIVPESPEAEVEQNNYNYSLYSSPPAISVGNNWWSNLVSSSEPESLNRIYSSEHHPEVMLHHYHNNIQNPQRSSVHNFQRWSLNSTPEGTTIVNPTAPAITTPWYVPVNNANASTTGPTSSSSNLAGFSPHWCSSEVCNDTRHQGLSGGRSASTQIHLQQIPLGYHQSPYSDFAPGPSARQPSVSTTTLSNQVPCGVHQGHHMPSYFPPTSAVPTQCIPVLNTVCGYHSCQLSTCPSHRPASAPVQYVSEFFPNNSQQSSLTSCPQPMHQIPNTSVSQSTSLNNTSFWETGTGSNMTCTSMRGTCSTPRMTPRMPGGVSLSAIQLPRPVASPPPHLTTTTTSTSSSHSSPESRSLNTRALMSIVEDGRTLESLRQSMSSNAETPRSSPDLGNFSTRYRSRPCNMGTGQVHGHQQPHSQPRHSDPNVTQHSGMYSARPGPVSFSSTPNVSFAVRPSPVRSENAHFSGGFSVFSSGYVSFQITHVPMPIDERLRSPAGRITHPLVSLVPMNPEGTSARINLTFEVHRF